MITSNNTTVLLQSPVWYAIRTKVKTEKYVLKSLTQKGIEAYVPILKKTRRYLRKIKHIEIPLISCYVFVKIVSDQRIKVLETEYVYKFIETKEQLGKIPEDEIIVLKRVVGDAGDALIARPNHWEEGQEVEIIGGSLTGIKGKLVKRSSKSHFIVSLATIGYDLEMEIDIALLQPKSVVA